MRALHRYAVLTTAATWLLIVAGGLVTSTDSGLAVPDWPLSYGTWLPPMVGGIVFEHGHRMIAGAVGLLILGLAMWLHRAEPRRWVRRLGDALLGAVIAQAVLGGLTVLFLLPVPVSVAHACLGQLVFCGVSVLALVTSEVWSRVPPSDDPGASRVARVSLLAAALVAGQLVLGAVIRHSGASVRWHVVGAVAVGVSLLALLVVARRAARAHPGWMLGAIALVVMVGAQVGLGLLAWSHRQQAVLTTAHQAFGALVLAGAVWMAALCRRAVRAQAGAAPGGSKPEPSPWSNYVALSKVRVTTLAAITTAVGFVMGSPHGLDWPRFALTLLGAFLVGSGANAMNQWYERDADAMMRRTAQRPLPTGRLRPRHALIFGLATTALGVALLAWHVNILAAGVALATFLSYVALYTPLKRVTSLCTVIGAVPGALPPLIGWAAAAGRLDVGGWILFGILFLWQLPHFLAIALVYRDEYARAGFQMLPVVEPSGESTGRQLLLYGLALVPTSLLPSVAGMAGWLYFVAALAVGCWLVVVAYLAAWHRTDELAKRLFLASVGYLPLLLIMMVLDRVAL